MDYYKLYSDELALCYFEQNQELSDEELELAFEEDETILEGELMSLLMNDNRLEGLD